MNSIDFIKSSEINTMYFLKKKMITTSTTTKLNYKDITSKNIECIQATCLQGHFLIVIKVQKQNKVDS